MMDPVLSVVQNVLVMKTLIVTKCAYVKPALSEVKMVNALNPVPKTMMILQSMHNVRE